MILSKKSPGISHIASELFQIMDNRQTVIRAYSMNLSIAVGHHENFMDKTSLSVNNLSEEWHKNSRGCVTWFENYKIDSQFIASWEWFPTRRDHAEVRKWFS